MFPLNLPNVLTVLRILLVPVLVVALLVETPNGSLIAAVVFAVAAITDGLDGYIARSRQVHHHLRQGDGPCRRQAADRRGADLARLPRPGRRLGRDGDHRARVRRQRRCAIAAGQQGVVIPASRSARLKTIVQLGRGAGADRSPGPRRRLGPGARLRDGRDHRVSGVDYFLNVRSRIGRARAERAARAGSGGDRSQRRAAPTSSSQELPRRRSSRSSARRRRQEREQQVDGRDHLGASRQMASSSARRSDASSTAGLRVAAWPARNRARAVAPRPSSSGASPTPSAWSAAPACP